jgi:RNA chaperone Hfq
MLMQHKNRNKQMTDTVETIFLDRLREKHITVYLTNGIKLSSILRDFDQHSVLLDNNLIYKHAISTIRSGDNE